MKSIFDYGEHKVVHVGKGSTVKAAMKKAKEMGLDPRGIKSDTIDDILSFED
jgi:hypothetical protein